MPCYEYLLYDNLLRRARSESERTLREYWTHKNDALDKNLSLGQTQRVPDTHTVMKTSETNTRAAPGLHVVSAMPNVSGPPELGKTAVNDGAPGHVAEGPIDVTLVEVDESSPIESVQSANQVKQHPLNDNVSYWVPPDSGLTEADAIHAFRIAAAVRAARRLIAQLREEQDHPGTLRRFNDAFNPFADRFGRDRDELSNLWDLEILLFELEMEWINKGYDRIEWSVFGIPADTGLEFAESIVTRGLPHALQEVSVEALLNIAGAASLLKFGATLLARGGMRLLASRSTVIRILPKEDGSVWDLGWSLRGQKIEQKLGHNVPPGFPTIDRWIAGEATSIKSMDLRAATYAKPEAILRVGGKYVDELLDFSGSAHGGTQILPGEVRRRTLRLAVPLQMTERQQDAIQTLIEYGQRKGVLVEIKRVY